MRTVTRRSITKHTFIGGVVALSLFAQTVAHAQTASERESARDAFREASELHQAGKNDEALPKYKAAHALAGTPITGLALAQCYADLGKLVEAREAALAIGKLPSNDTTPALAKAREDAESLAEDLHTRIPSLSVHLTGASDGASVTVNGKAVNTTVLATPLRVNPGAYTIIVTGAHGSRQRRKVDLKENDVRQLAIEVSNASATSDEEAADEHEAPPKEAIYSKSGAAGRAFGFFADGGISFVVADAWILGLSASAGATLRWFEAGLSGFGGIVTDGGRAWGGGFLVRAALRIPMKKRALTIGNGLDETALSNNGSTTGLWIDALSFGFESDGCNLRISTILDVGVQQYSNTYVNSAGTLTGASSGLFPVVSLSTRIGYVGGSCEPK